MKANAKALHLLLCCQFLATFGLMVLIPIMPLYLEKLTADAGDVAIWASIALAAPAVGSMLTAPLLGRLADRWGYRNILTIALSGFCLALVLMSVSETIALFLFSRVLLGLCGISVAITAYTSHLVESDSLVSGFSRGSALAKLQSAIAAACLSGPLAGGLFMDQWGIELLLNLTAAMTCIALIAAMLLLQGVPSSPLEQSNPALAKGWYLNWQTFSWLSAGAFAQGGAFALVTCFALYINDLEQTLAPSATATGVLHAMAWAATFVAGAYWGKRNDQGDAVGSFITAAVGCGVTVLALLWVNSLWLIALLRIIQGFFFAALIPAVMYSIGKQASSSQQGQAIGTAKSALVLGQLIGPLAAAGGYSFFQASGAIAISAAFFATAALFLILNKNTTNQKAIRL